MYLDALCDCFLILEGVLCRDKLWMLFSPPCNMPIFFSVGLNCSFGARQLKPFLEQLAARAPYYISAYPNAGLPNSLGTYDQTPADMAHEVKEYIHEGLVNIIVVVAERQMPTLPSTPR